MALGGLVIALFCLPLYFYVKESNRAIGFAETEARGVRSVQALLRLVLALQDERDREAPAAPEVQARAAGGEASSVAAAMTALDAESALLPSESARAHLGEVREALSAWQALGRQGSPEGGVADSHALLLEKLLSLIIEVADASNLTLDPDIDSYYLMDVGILRAPFVREDLRRLRDVTARTARAGQASVADRIAGAERYASCKANISAITTALGKVFAKSPRARGPLEAVARMTLQETERSLREVEPFLFDNDSASAEALALARMPAIHMQGELAVASIEQLSYVIADRIDALTSHRARLLGAVFGLFALTSSIAIYIVFGLIRSVTEPVLTLARGTQAIAEGDLGYRVKLEGAYEFSALADRFNLMAARLECSIDSAESARKRLQAVLDNVDEGIVTVRPDGTIETANQGAKRLFGKREIDLVGTDIRELLVCSPSPGESPGATLSVGMSEAEGRRSDGATFPAEVNYCAMRLGDRDLYVGLVRDITERKRVERMKAEFVSTVSHELRTPLTSIRGSLGLIRGGVGGALPAQSKKLLDIAYGNCERLILLINDILDIEKISAGKMVLDIKSQEVTPLIEQAVLANRDYAVQRGVRFRVDETLQGANVEVDAGRLLQIMANLLSNAAKFSPSGGEVVVSVARHSGWARISVTDHGSGIPLEFQKRIFEKFSQADSSDTRTKGGTGLGLALCKSMVELMGGRISFESEPGVKTTFFVDLRLHEPIEALAAAAKGEGPRILICEDDVDVANLIGMMLDQQGYRWDIATTAAAARSMLAARSYAAMTLDLRLPDMDGATLIHELRAAEATRDLPIVVVSAVADEGKRALGGGGIHVIDWMSKPIDQSRLLQAIHRQSRGRGGDLPRVLHVEDDAGVREIIGTLLAGRMTFDAVGTLHDAQEALARERYDLVILDLDLPDGSGSRLLPRLSERVPPIPVIVFSASEHMGDRAENVVASLVKTRASNEDLLSTITAAVRPMYPSEEGPRRDVTKGSHETP